MYRSQAVFPAALALALLYLTVMNFVSLLCQPQMTNPRCIAEHMGVGLSAASFYPQLNHH